MANAHEPPSPAAEGLPLPRQRGAGRSPDRVEFRLVLAVFTLALVVRFYFLYEHSHNPTFFQPTVDSLQYHLTARGLVEGRGFDFGFFWQPFFYPFTLAVIYFFAGPSIIWAKIIQALLGACTCALTYRLGRRVFDRPTGLLAGLMTALYGPLAFYDGELLGECWASFWSVALMLLLLRSAERKTRLLGLLTGACGALAVVTRPTFLPFCFAAFVWLAWVLVREGRAGPAGGRRYGGVAALLVGFLLAATPIAGLHQRVVGHVGLLPVSGGVNFYIGNNANPCETLTIRPGERWVKLLAQPVSRGCRTHLEQSRFFYGQVWEFAASDPGSFAKGLAHKAVQFAGGREIPRNLDIYTFHEWSRLLRVLVWKAGGFGFPWGVVFPLAVVGYVCRCRRVPVPVTLFATLYPLAVILVFVAGRYRLPAVPVFCTLAAAGCTSIIGMIRSRRWLPALAMVSAAGGLVVTTSLPGPWCEEKINYSAEMYLLLGDDWAISGKHEQAAQFYREALRREPDYARAHDHLGVALAELGQYREAAAQLDEALIRATDPDTRFAILFNRAHARTLAGDLAGALRDYDAALALRPEAAQAYFRRGVVYHDLGEYGPARRDWEEALNSSPPGDIAERARSRLERLREEGH